MKIWLFAFIGLTSFCAQVEASSNLRKWDSALENSWHCDACTYLNDSHASRCQLCNTVKNYLKLSQAARDENIFIQI